MTVLQVADVRFGHGADVLFEDVTFSLALGERAALVAPNGAGKTTLLRIIARELQADSGTAIIKSETRFAFYRQSHEIRAEGDVLGAFLAGFADVLQLRDELGKAQREAASGSEAALSKLAEAHDRYHHAQGDALEHEVAALASKLGFSDADLVRPVASLSGGERGRLRLGTVLAKKPDLLLLDEPTNHLDLDTIDWFEEYLKESRAAVVLVSHDRAFLDNVCPITMELGRKALRVYPLRYTDYAVARQEDLARERELLERQEAFIEKTEDFIRRNIARASTTARAQSRRKMLDKLERVERPEDVWAVADRVRLRFAPAQRTGAMTKERQTASNGGTRQDMAHSLFCAKVVLYSTRLELTQARSAGEGSRLACASGLCFTLSRVQPKGGRPGVPG